MDKEYDLICVGGGIMSATLAVLTKLLDPNLKILILERLDKVAQESSFVWNNAGTGHSALCELNYTPVNEDGTINIEKALSIFNQFENSKQFWTYLKRNNFISHPEDFVRNVPHHSWVYGEEDVQYLKKRHETLREHPRFSTMQYTEDIEQMMQWFPLIAEKRAPGERMAATRMEKGCEMNFGRLTEILFQILEEHFDTKVQCNHEVIDIDPDQEIDWTVEVKHTESGEIHHIEGKHVFIGAGGHSLLLLQKVEIDEKEGYGGFPVSGQWLVCKNQDVIERHHAKVYTKSGPDAPPMSTPHLDTRYIDGKKGLLFGPFAGFSPKFLKEGSNLDLFKSVKRDNILPLLGAFWHNLPLTNYLIQQLAMGHKERMDELRKFYRNARDEDWELYEAGQRVQIIKKDEFEGGVLRFGTEVVHSTCGTITCLLGASPGASTAVSVMLEVLEHAFPEVVNSHVGQKRLKEIVPTYRYPAFDDYAIEIYNQCNEILNI